LPTIQPATTAQLAGGQLPSTNYIAIMMQMFKRLNDRRSKELQLALKHAWCDGCNFWSKTASPI